MHFILSEQGWQNSIRFVTINISRLLRTSGLKVSMGKSLAVFRNNCLSLHSSCVKKAKKSTFLKKKRLWFACSFIELKCMWLQTVLAYLKNTKQLKCCLKPCTHDQICIRMQILHICKICVRTQIWPCVRIYSRMQNLHVCKSWKICTCLRPSANLILRIRKICVYANLVM